MNFAKSVSLNLSAGGKVGGNLEIDGDLTVNGDSSGAYDEIINGHLDLADNNILNVGDISLDTISSDAGTSINVVLGSDSGDDFLVDTDKLVVEGDTGNIGIGTASPSDLLHLSASVPIIRLTDSDTNDYHRIYGSNGSLYFDADKGDGVGSSKIAFGVDDSNVMNIIDGGVGIGTDSPGEALHVRGSAPTVKVQEDGTSHYVELEGGGSTAFINFYDSLRFREGTTERMRIDGSGNLGIGTDSPANNAHIYSTSSETGLLIQSNLGGSGSAIGGQLKLALGARNNSGSGQDDTQSGDILGQIMFEGQGTDYSYQGGNIKTIVTTGDGNDNRSNQGTAMTFETIAVGSVSPAERLRIKSNGEVQFGSSSGTGDIYHYGAGKFAINDSAGSASTPTYSFNSDTDTGMYRTGANEIGFATGGTERMSIESNGNIYFGGVTSQVNSSHFQYASTFGDTSAARVGFFNASSGNASTDKTLSLNIGCMGHGTSAWHPTNMVIASLNFLGQANDATYAGGGIDMLVSTGGNIARSSVGTDMLFRTMDTSSTGGTERMRITSDGKVGIGTTSPARILDLNGASNTDGIRFNNSGYAYYNEICNNGDGLIFRVDPGTSGGSGVDFRWTINDSEKMRLVQSGRLGINATTVHARLHVNEGTSSQEVVYLDHTASGIQTMILFKTEGSTRGSIQSDNSPSETHYNTSSDKRLKENIVEVDDALSIVNKIPVKQFNFIEDKNKTPLIGYIGQELVKEYPRAVSVTKTDEYDDHHMVDQSKMVAVLMKAVQELSAKVEALENA